MRFLLSLTLMAAISASCAHNHHKKECCSSDKKCADAKDCKGKKENKKDCCKNKDAQTKDA